MVLSFNEFNALYEENTFYNDYEEYSDGIDIMESLMTVIARKGSITETQTHMFLDNVLEDTGWELNDEIYEDYSEWINDWSQFIDVTINESEEEMDLYLTRRGELMLEIKNQDGASKIPGMDKITGTLSGAKNAISGAYGSTKKSAGDLKNRSALDQYKSSKGTGNKLSQMVRGAKGTIKDSSRGQKIGMGLAAGAAAGAVGYGAYKGIKALKKRRDAKKAAAAQQ